MLRLPSNGIELLSVSKSSFGASSKDSKGDVEYNKWLSGKRAKNAEDYLEAKGISPARITSEGAGETNLVNKCSDGVSCTEDEHSQNRRTEAILTFKNNNKY